MGGVKDIDRGWKKIKEEIKLIDNSFVNVGVLSDSGGYAASEGGINLADVATFNEFGTSRIPPRPFMRQTFEKNNKKTTDFISKQKDLIYQGKETTRGALETIGVFYQGKIQTEFNEGNFKANAPATIRQKTVNGNVGDRPLHDTGRLKQSINFEVKIK